MGSPDTLARNSLGIRIQNNLVLVEDHALLCIIGAVESVCILKVFDIDIENDHGPNITNTVAVREG